MNITLQWFKEQNAPKDLYAWAVGAFSIQTPINSVTLIQNLLTANKPDWANYVLVRILTHTQKIQYGIFAAEIVEPVFSNAYPNDGRLTEAISASKAYLVSPSPDNASRAARASTGASEAATVSLNAGSDDSNIHAHFDTNLNSADALKDVLTTTTNAATNNAAHAVINAVNITYCNVSAADSGLYFYDTYAAVYATNTYNYTATAAGYGAYVASVKNNEGYGLANTAYLSTYNSSKTAMINYGIGLLLDLTIPTHLTVKQADVNLREMVLNWDDNSNNRAGFSIKVTGPANYLKVITVPPSITKYTLFLTGNAANGDYSFSVASFDGATYSSYCPPVVLPLIITPTILAEAPVLSAVISSVFNGLDKAIEPLSWTVPEGAIRVDVYSTLSSAINITPVWTLAYQEIPPNNSVNYAFGIIRYNPLYFQIRCKAIYPTGESDWSNVITISGHSIADAVVI